MKKLPIRIEPKAIENETEPIVKLLTILTENFSRPNNSDSIKHIMDVISNDTVDAIEKRGVDVFINTLGQKQYNVESIINKSIKYLPLDKVVSPTMPDQEWVLDFFDLCQNCSNEEVQEIWAKLLADKVDDPDAHSRRLMHTIKLLEVKEARTFNSLSKCFCEITLGGNDEELDDLGLNFGTAWVAGDSVYAIINSWFHELTDFHHGGVDQWSDEKLRERVAFLSQMSNQIKIEISKLKMYTDDIALINKVEKMYFLMKEQIYTPPKQYLLKLRAWLSEYAECKSPEDFKAKIAQKDEITNEFHTNLLKALEAVNPTMKDFHSFFRLKYLELVTEKEVTDHKPTPPKTIV